MTRAWRRPSGQTGQGLRGPRVSPPLRLQTQGGGLGDPALQGGRHGTGAVCDLLTPHISLLAVQGLQGPRFPGFRLNERRGPVIFLPDTDAPLPARALGRRGPGPVSWSRQSVVVWLALSAGSARPFSSWGLCGSRCLLGTGHCLPLRTPECSPWQSRLGAHSCVPWPPGPGALRDSSPSQMQRAELLALQKVYMLIMSHLENKDAVKKIKAPIIVSFRYIVVNVFTSVTVVPYICVYIHTYTGRFNSLCTYTYEYKYTHVYIHRYTCPYANIHIGLQFT